MERWILLTYAFVIVLLVLVMIMPFLIHNSKRDDKRDDRNL